LRWRQCGSSRAGHAAHVSALNGLRQWDESLRPDKHDILLINRNQGELGSKTPRNVVLYGSSHRRHKK
jgi:hypothetical protein